MCRNGARALVPAKTAHIVVDLQNAFVAPGGVAEVPISRDIVPNVNQICSAVRRAGGVNIFLRFTVDENETNAWSPMHDRIFPEVFQGLKAAFGRGADQHQLWQGLDVSCDDIVLDKTRFSGLIPGTCDLQTVLATRGIDTLIITGTLTNCCCEATARDAMQIGYFVLFIEDGCATHDDDVHNNTLSNLLAFGYADICSAQEAIERLTVVDASLLTA
jgi:ureidoacrylate peracid hydrolase